MNTEERRSFVDTHLHTTWGWVNYSNEGVEDAWSLRRIHAWALKQHPKFPTVMTLKRDIDKLRERASLPTEEEKEEAIDLLAPENFPAWRAKFFTVPETGMPFETPPFQHAIFHVLYSLTFKTPIPQWAIDLLDELDPVHPFPEDLNELIVQAGDHTIHPRKKTFLSFILMMAPRHGKTELLVHFTEYVFAKDPNKRIMFGNGTIKKSAGFIDNAVMSFLEGLTPAGETFVQMYGPFKDDRRPWSKEGFTLAGRTTDTKSYSMQPFGISGNIRSFDADLILGDDLQDLKRARSENVTQEDYEWFTTELMLRREKHTALVKMGSHVASQSGDMFTLIENNLEKLNVGKQRTIMKKLPAHMYDRCDPVNDPEHENCVLWPELRDYGFLEAQRANLDDDAMYEAVYNQIPRTLEMEHFPGSILRSKFHLPELPEGATVTPPPTKEEDIGVLDMNRNFHEAGPICCGKQTITVMGFDPAISESKGAAFTAWVVLSGCPYCGRRYIIDYGQTRVSPEVHPDMIDEVLTMYSQIEAIAIEINQYQTALARDPRTLEYARKHQAWVKEWRTDERKHSYEAGIPQMGRHVKAGLFSIPYENLYDQEYAEGFLKELIRWPQRPNDRVMACWLADRVLSEIIEDTKHATPELMYGTEQWMSEAHYDQMYEVDLTEIEADWEYVG